MNDIKVFITIDLESKDVDQTGEHANQDVAINKTLEIAKYLIWHEIPTQIKMTNLPPRKTGFVRASDLIDIEKD